ncbi:PAS domain-containing protein [Methylonatrum kenyense]|uniref:PAS domain-containing protein n=1 Tax=Methylonatrum kenyense TaxID=455253 RepID=UPI0020BFA75E|nr:PAS domain-containing protein [Methylonatrum kenyense]MCK8517347.1 PAS domain-containing protein [Methylonatrum kenyense]
MAERQAESTSTVISDADYQVILDGIDGAVLVSAGATILYASARARELLAHRAADLTVFADRVIEADRIRFEALLRETAGRVKLPRRRQIRLRLADGREDWFEVSVTTRLLGGRRLRIWTLLDVSERKRAEQRLSDGLGSLARLVSNLQGMAYRCSHSRQWDMHFVSDGCFELTGYASSELLYSRTIAYGDLVPAEDLEPALEQVRAAVAADEPFRLIYRIVTATGEEKTVLDQGAGVRDADGDVTELEGFITDISGLRDRLAAG